MIDPQRPMASVRRSLSAALRPLVSRPSVVRASLSFATVILPISSEVQVFFSAVRGRLGGGAAAGSAAAASSGS